MFCDKYNDNCVTNIIFIIKYISLLRFTLVMFTDAAPSWCSCKRYDYLSD